MPQKGALIFLIVALAALLPVLLQIAWPFLTPLILASILAIMMSPIKEWLNRRIHRPGVASLLTTVAVVTLLGILIALVGVILTGELTDVYNSLSRRSLDEGGWPALVTRATDRIVDALATRLPIDKDAIRTELIDRMKTASGYLLSNVGAAVGGVTTAVITFLLVTLFLYFLLRYGRNWVAWLAALTPLESGTRANLIKTVHDSVMANLSGMFVVVLAQGALLILGFWIAGVQSPVLWGALGGLASIIPVLGAMLIWLPVAIAYFLIGSFGKAVFLVVWGAVLVGSADNVLRSWVVGAREKQHPILVALAAIGGAYAFGALGILLGPLLVSLAAALMKEIQHLIPSHTVVIEAACESTIKQSSLQ